MIRAKLIPAPENFPFQFDLPVDVVRKAIQLYHFFNSNNEIIESQNLNSQLEDKAHNMGKCPIFQRIVLMENLRRQYFI